MTGTYRFRKPVVEKGTIPSTWVMADADKASAEALQSLKAGVTVIDGKVKSNADSLTQLNTKVDNNQAELVLNYYTRTQADEATSNMVNKFSSELRIGGQNLITGTQDFNTEGNFKPNYVGFGTRWNDNKLFTTNTIYISTVSWCGFYFTGFPNNVLQDDCVLSFWASSQNNSSVGVYNIANGGTYLG